MRPIDRGAAPHAQPLHYSYWRNELIQRIGYYCAYCNMPLSHNLNVEHVVPKNPPAGYVPGDTLAWDNMLLACGPCNNAKGNTPVTPEDYYLPDAHNTLLPFHIVIDPNHADSAIVEPATNLLAHQYTKAARTIELLALNEFDERDNVVDIRWKRRRDAIVAVESARFLYNIAMGQANNPNAIANCIVTIARGIGFFGLWFDAFMYEPLVIQSFVHNFPGTSSICFDNNFLPVDRNPTDLTDPT